MIVSRQIAVLPVFWSPMISSRWPRPMLVIASMALMPVSSGSFTDWRWTTEGACSSSARLVSTSTSPLPSSGRPSRSRACSIRLRTLPSNTSSPTRTTTDPMIDASTVKRSSTGLPITRASTSARRARRSASSGTAVRTSATTRLRRLAASSARSWQCRSSSRPWKRSRSRPIRAAARGWALPPARSPTSARVRSSGRAGSVRAARSSGVRSISAPKRNRSSSTRSRSPAAAAAAKLASAASSASRSGSRRGATRCRSARVASSSTVAGSSWPRPRSVSRPRLASAGSPRSTSGPRRRGCAAVTRAKVARSPATLSSPPRPAASWKSRSACAASAGLLRGTAAVPAPSGQGTGLGVVAELLDVLVDQPELPLAVERVADHPGGELDRQRADLGPQLAHGTVALGPDRLASLGDHPLGLLLGLVHEVPAQPVGVGPALVDDALRLLLGTGQTLAVLPQQLLGLLALALRVLELPFDALGPLLERLVGAREREPPQQGEEHGERDDADDQLVHGGKDRVLRLPLRGDERGNGDENLGTPYLIANASTKPKSASASTKARPMNIVVRTIAAASGCRAIPSSALPIRIPRQMPGPTAPRP